MLLPVLLGDGSELARHAISFYRAYGVSSFAFTLHPHPLLPHLLPLQIRRLTREELPFLSDVLTAFAEAQDDKILCLVPCNEAFRRFVEENRKYLEECYVCTGQFANGQVFHIPSKRGNAT